MKLRQSHSEEKITAGIDVINGAEKEDMVSINVVEPLLVKSSMIKTAAEAAAAVLKIDDIIAASPLKKEEKEKKEKEKEEGKEETSFGKSSF